MSRKLSWLFVLFAFCPVAQAAVPTTSRYAVLEVNRLDTVVLEPLDLARLGEEDAARDRKGMPPRFAVPEPVSIAPADRGTWEDLGDGRMLWRLRILGREGVTSLSLGFTHFKMANGGRLLLYSTDGRQVSRPVTAADNERHRELWTPVLLTRDLIVELTVPKSEVPAVELKLGSINQGYRGFGTIPAGSYNKSGSCNLDVECLDAGDPWRKQVRSVGVISTGNGTFCSGSLINDTAGDRKMYFMTANHCGINSSNAASLVVYWNYQNSYCRTPGSAQSGQSGDGTLTQFHTGSTFRAANAASDFTLVELVDPPVPAYKHFWAGWDRSAGDFACSAATPCATIHHPNTEEKRITYSTTPTATTSDGGTASPGDGTHIWVHWATDPPGPFTVPGVTEPGSSGSPLYSPAGRYIGQLHGGPSACGATGNSLSDYYGRFSRSWTGGGTSSTRLSTWLDAGNTGATAIDGLDTLVAPADFYTLTPCRLVDTRNPNDPNGPAISSHQSRALVLAGSCGIPPAATAVSLIVTVVNPAGDGFLSLSPASGVPSIATVNFRQGQVRANNAIVALNANGAVTVYDGAAGSVDYVVDVNGYFL
jgi:lysyl endopeptidase